MNKQTKRSLLNLIKKSETEYYRSNFNAANNLVFETDISAIADDETWLSLLNRATEWNIDVRIRYSDGRFVYHYDTLTYHLPSNVLKKNNRDLNALAVILTIGNRYYVCNGYKLNDYSLHRLEHDKIKKMRENLMAIYARDS